MTAPVSHTTNTKPARHAGGFTLAEALIASVVLAISAMAIANSMAACDKSQEWLQQSVNCQGLAKQLVEEISSRSFSVEPNPGYSTGHTNRALYDDVADYNGYTDNSASSAGITTLSGTKISFNDGATYTRTVSFQYRTTPGGSGAASGDFGMITVTVSSNGGASVTLQRLVVNDAGLLN